MGVDLQDSYFFFFLKNFWFLISPDFGVVAIWYYLTFFFFLIEG